MVMRRISRKCAAPATSLFTCQAPYFHSTPSRFQSKDYYKTLGVSRNASADDIKQAYKKKIKSLHPDVNADPRAAEEFAKVKEAAETLQDPQKKSMYDMSGGTGGMGGAASGFPGGASGFPGMGMPGFDPSKMGMGMGGAGGFNFGDFEEVLKGMGSKKDNVKKAQGPEPGSDVHYKLKLSFLEAVNGVSKEISYNTMRKCTGCAGSGNQESGSKGQCPHCGGKGKKVMSTGFFHMQQDCTNCGGTGDIGRVTCTQCSGKGAVKDRSVQTLPVPKGVGGKERLKVSGKGEAGIRNGPPGNLYVEITVDDHPVFHRDGIDVHIVAPVSLSTAVLGGTIRVPTLTGEVETKVPPGSQQGDKLVLRGRGVNRPNQNKTGDFYIHFAILLPKKLTEEQKKAIADFAKDEKNIQLTDPQLQELKNRYRSWFSA